MPYASIIDEIIRKEGGYVNHPNDKGGPTKFGITLNTLTNWRGKTCTIRDVQNLTVDEAKLIYSKLYISAPRFDQLPERIQEQVIDMGVNSGVGTATILLIRACRTLNPASTVPEGVTLGQNELKFISDMVLKFTAARVSNTLVDERLRYLAKITGKKPKNATFIQGWVDRALSFRVWL